MKIVLHFMLGLLVPSCALPCPQGTANAVLKPQAKSSLFLSHRGIRAHRQDWEHWGSQPLQTGPCWTLTAAVSWSQPCSPLLCPTSGAGTAPAPQTPSSGVPAACPGLFRFVPRGRGCPHAQGPLQLCRAGALRSRRGLWSLLDTEERACLSLL